MNSQMISLTKTTKGRITIITIAFISLLLVSGVIANVAAYSSPPSVQQSNTSIPAASPTYIGTVGANPTGAFLTGPYTVTPTFTSTPVDPPGNAPTPMPTTAKSMPYPGASVPTTKSAAGVDPPTANCPSHGGCESISGTNGGAKTNALALNAAVNQLAYGYTIEPPDQAVCANSAYTMEILNVGDLQLYSTSSLNPVPAGFDTLDDLMGLNSNPSTGGVNSATGLNWGSAGDVMCNYDYSNGGHWIITEIVSASPEPASPFSGCFAGVPDTCLEGIAVSQSSSPMGPYNVYFFNPNVVNSDPGSDANPDSGGNAGVLLNDFAKQGTTKDAFLLFYDQFNLYGLGVADGAGTAQELAFDKTALETGASASSINVAYENMGTAPSLYPIPENGAFQPGAGGTCTTSSTTTYNYVCWFEVIPAQTPDPSQYDNANGGTGWMVGALDYLGLGDNRVAAFDWTGLCNLDNSCPSTFTGGVQFGGTIYTTPQVTYMDEGVPCLAQYGGYCGLAQQKSGPIPLGDLCGIAGLSIYAASCPEGGIATNGDSATQASYADGQLWTAIPTLVDQQFGNPTSRNGLTTEIHVGAAYWAINAEGGSVTSAGITSPTHEDLEFPSIAATDGGSALMSFTLSGPDYYPSSAFTWLTGSSSGVIHITAMGKSPQDGFSEYQFFPNNPNYRPRWGDYGAAIYVPSSSDGHNGYQQGGTIIFASEYIQAPNCGDQAFLNGITPSGTTCGGTRAVFANWGSSISSISASGSGSGSSNGFNFNLNF